MRYKSQRYLSRCRPPFPSAFLSAMAIIRKTFEGTKVRTFVPSFSPSSHSSFVRALCLRSDAPTVFCSLCLFFLLGIQCRNCLDHLFAYLLRVQPRKIPSFSPFLLLPSRSSLILDLPFSISFFLHFIISLPPSPGEDEIKYVYAKHRGSRGVLLGKRRIGREQNGTEYRPRIQKKER